MLLRGLGRRTDKNACRGWHLPLCCNTLRSLRGKAAAPLLLVHSAPPFTYRLCSAVPAQLGLKSLPDLMGFWLMSVLFNTALSSGGTSQCGCQLLALGLRAGAEHRCGSSCPGGFQGRCHGNWYGSGCEPTPSRVPQQCFPNTHVFPCRAVGVPRAWEAALSWASHSSPCTGMLW